MESIVLNQPPVSFEADREHDQSQNGWIEPRIISGQTIVPVARGSFLFCPTRFALHAVGDPRTRRSSFTCGQTKF